MSRRIFGTCLLALAALAFAACGEDGGAAADAVIDASTDTDTGTDSDTGSDIDTDSDTDTDKDTDGDTDIDTDGDTDSETDTDLEDECLGADTFDPEECPAVDSDDARIRFVNVAVAAAGDGSSWDSAFATAQPAIDACRCVVLALGGTCQTWVALGTYEIHQSDPCDSVRLRPGVELYGGFAGGEDALEERDWEENVTTLDGLDLSYHVVVGSDDAVIDGFTITGGNADGIPYLYASNYGGGMFNESASPAVTNCTFTGNSAWASGGGMYNLGSSPTVTGCVFSDNFATTGGGMANRDESSPTVTDCDFSDNTTRADGGGMFNDTGSSPAVINCTFSGNTMIGIDDDVSESGDGAGMFNNGSSSPIVMDCIFSGNEAYCDGGGMFNQYFSSPVVTGCSFEGNVGGGMYNRSFSSPIVTSCIFSGNSGYLGGGMTNSSESIAIVTDCVFENNSAQFGGGMANNLSSPVVTNCTFSGNTAGYNWGGGLDNRADSSPIMTNCVLWGDTNEEGVSEIFNDDSSSPIVTFSTVQDGYPGDGNIDADPLFADAAGGDLTLTAGSPCIDTGDNSLLPADVADLDGDGDTDEPLPLDLAGDPRVADGDGDDTATVDMGAYEFQP